MGLRAVDCPRATVTPDAAGGLERAERGPAAIPGSGRSPAPRPHLGIPRTRLGHQLPEPQCLTPVPALLGQLGEVAPGQVAVDALIDATEAVGTLQAQDPPPASFGLGGLAGLAVEHGLAEVELGVVGVDPQALGAGARAAGRSSTISWQRAIRAYSLRTIESLGADRRRLR